VIGRTSPDATLAAKFSRLYGGSAVLTGTMTPGSDDAEQLHFALFAEGADVAADSANMSAGSRWTVNHVSQSNPTGPGQGDVAALLRRLADTVEQLGDGVIEDLTFASTPTSGERDLRMTVYYHPRCSEDA
jgi:hypothetical protein